MKNLAPDLKIDTLALALSLMEIPSVSGQEQQVIAFVDALAQSWGFATRLLPVAASGRANLLIHGTQAPKVLLSTHLDVVPGGLAPRRDTTWLYGRGACDAKGIAAAMLGALVALREGGIEQVGLLLVVGEETHSDGAKAAAQQLDPVALLINGEPTELQFVSAQRGALAFDLSASGKACHSGYPEQGHSAIHALCDALQTLRSTPWPSDPVLGSSLVNVGVIQGGQAANVLADAASAQVMMRLAVPFAPVEQALRAQLSKGFQLNIRTRSDPQRLWVPKGQAGCVVGFASDVAHLRPIAARIAMLGPGRIHDAHSDSERVAIADLDRAKAMYKQLCVDFLTAAPTAGVAANNEK